MKYWLMKSEPNCFSLDDLKKKKDQTEMWDGVRNYQARNIMRDEMKVGDKVFFYHSNCNPPHIAGICKVASKPYTDPTQFDPKNDHYDPKSDPENPRWTLVDVKYVKDFGPISLPQLRANPKLKKMKLLQKGARLSVQPVEKDEWDEILAMCK